MKSLHLGCWAYVGLVLLTSAWVRADIFIPAVTRASTGLSQGDKDTIAAFLKEQLAAIQAGADGGMGTTRDRLVEASKALGDPCSPVYLDEYSGELNAALMPLLRGRTLPVRVRLNLAIAMYKIADNAQNGRLAPAAVELLKDQRDDVCLWGMKVAEKVIVSDVQTNGVNSSVLRAILPAAQAHSLNGSIVKEAYTALTPPNQNDPGFLGMVTNAIPELLKLFKLRVDMYDTALPDEPEAEKQASYALTTKAVWGALVQPDKERVMQFETTLLMRCLQYFSDPKLPKESRAAALAVIENCGETVEAVGFAAGIQPLVDNPGALVMLLRSDASKESTPTDVQPLIAPILPAIKAAFPNVKVPDMAQPTPATATDPPATQSDGQ